MKKICEHCKEQFWARLQKIRFCSNGCARRYANPERFKKCKQCNKEFKITVDRKFFCSLECYFANVKAKKTVYTCKTCKKKLATYNSYRKRSYCSKDCLYNRPIKRKYRTKALNNFEKKCSICGDCKKTIDIHHINGNREINEIENLIALCRGCHIRVHKSSTKHNLNLMQSLEFVKLTKHLPKNRRRKSAVLEIEKALKASRSLCL